MRSGIKRVRNQVDRGQDLEVSVLMGWKAVILQTTRAEAALDIFTTRHPLAEGFINI